MNRKRILLGYLFGFMMTITLSVFILLLITKFTVFRKEYVLNVLEKDEYYLKLNDEIKEEMSLHLLSSGFADEILENIFSYDNVVNDTKAFTN